MEFTVANYSKVKDLAKDIKGALDSCLNKTIFPPLVKSLNREELKQYLGKTLDDNENRDFAFTGGSLCKTMRGIFTRAGGDARRKLFVELLLKYNEEVYGTLLADINIQA